MLRDLKFAVRQLLKSPGFTLTAALTLALGIGSNTAIFTLVDSIMLRPLPFPQQDRLMQIGYDWLTTPNPVLCNLQPIEIANTSEGAAQVEEVLTRIDYGIFS
jgi:hypothetical protein